MDIPVIPERFPIRDLAYHGKCLDGLEQYPKNHPDVKLLAQWHVTAIAYLQYGVAHKLGGPGVELRRPNSSQPALIEPELFRSGKRKGYFNVKVKR